MTRSRVALVTGCSSGIGRSTCERFLADGFHVYATARRPETLADLERAGARALPLDVTDEDSMVRAVQEVQTAEGAVGILVNNAGYGLEVTIEQGGMDDVRRQFETNVFGLARLTQLVLPGMRKQGWGRVINVSSMGGRMAFPGGGYYHASKYAVEAISDALRFEVRPFGIRVSVIEPGIVLTAFGDTSRQNIPRGSGDDPYAVFNEGLDHKIADAFEGTLAKLASSPDAVARRILHAATSRWPKTRYRVGVDARSVIVLRRLLPDRAFDLVLRAQFPHAKRRR